jgi:fluoride ion exporter CrcB/FEX
MLVSVLCVAVGAIFGALARFLITHFSSELSHHHGFPYGTLAVNVVGCDNRRIKTGVPVRCRKCLQMTVQKLLG